MNIIRVFNRLLQRAGLRVSRDRQSVYRTLWTARAAGFTPGTVIDVGAAHGDWSRMCRRVYPNAEYILVEPLSEYFAFHRSMPHERFIPMAAGEFFLPARR